MDSAPLLADIEIESDGITYDPAAWQDWLRIVAQVVERGIEYDPAVWEDWVRRNDEAKRNLE